MKYREAASQYQVHIVTYHLCGVWCERELPHRQLGSGLLLVHGLVFTGVVHARTVVQGELEMWNKAEAALTDALNSTGREWSINEGGRMHTRGTLYRQFKASHTRLLAPFAIEDVWNDSAPLLTTNTPVCVFVHS